MGLSGTVLRDCRTVAVGPNSTVVAGFNAKRKHLIISPTSMTQVWINPVGPAVANQGAVLVQPMRPWERWCDADDSAIAQQVTACTADGTTNVYVEDEFWG